MITSAFMAFLHFVAVFGIVGTLFFEWLTLSKAPTWIEARRIQRCDMWYGIFAGILVLVGLLRVYHFEKGSAFYFSNPFFHLKMALFIAIGLLSIYPTMKFLRWRKETRRELAPVVAEAEFIMLRRILALELVLLLGVALCASLMARGIRL